MNKTSKRILAIGAAAAVLTGTGVAWAYWTTTGSGTGQATAGADVNADKIHIVQNGTNTGFYPGSAAQAVKVDVNNPADFSQKVGNITVTVADALGTNGLNCALSNWDVVDTSAATENIPTLAKNNLAAGGADEATAVTVATLQLKDLTTNQDNCKGAVPVLTFASAPGA